MTNKLWFENSVILYALEDCSTFIHYFNLAVRLKNNGWSQINLFLLFEFYSRIFWLDETQNEHISDILDCIWGGSITRHSLYEDVISVDDLDEMRKTLQKKMVSG